MSKKLVVKFPFPIYGVDNSSGERFRICKVEVDVDLGAGDINLPYIEVYDTEKWELSQEEVRMMREAATDAAMTVFIKTQMRAEIEY